MNQLSESILMVVGIVLGLYALYCVVGVLVIALIIAQNWPEDQ